MTESYLDEALGRFLDRLARRDPTPGGGAAAALTVSLAASLVAMAARYSTPQIADGQMLVERAESLRRRVRHLADDDARAFAGVLAANATGRAGGSDEGRLRAAALLRATEVPLEVAEIGAQTAQLAVVLAVNGKPDVRGDAATALLLAEAGTRAAAHLVSVNVEAQAARGGDVDGSRGGVIRGDGHELLLRAKGHAESARAAVASARTLTELHHPYHSDDTG